MTNRWFLDTEFNEDGKTIELISLALVPENGEGFEWVSSEFDESKCNDWVKANVLPHLGSYRAPRDTIAHEVKQVLLAGGHKPEIWGYFCDYDWVVLCWLYGRMVDLPKGFPFYCLDLKQEMHRLGIKKEELPEQTGVEHNALADARWIRDAWLTLKFKEQQTKMSVPRVTVSE